MQCAETEIPIRVESVALDVTGESAEELGLRVEGGLEVEYLSGE
jgi:hypothetical protein